jgi:hypothetical protein
MRICRIGFFTDEIVVQFLMLQIYSDPSKKEVAQFCSIVSLISDIKDTAVIPPSRTPRIGQSCTPSLAHAKIVEPSFKQDCRLQGFSISSSFDIPTRRRMGPCSLELAHSEGSCGPTGLPLTGTVDKYCVKATNQFTGSPWSGPMSMPKILRNSRLLLSL